MYSWIAAGAVDNIQSASERDCRPSPHRDGWCKMLKLVNFCKKGKFMLNAPPAPIPGAAVFLQSDLTNR
jgi:hypothetical protein